MASGYSKRGKIPDELKPVVYSMYFGENKLQQEISDWLLKEHNIPIAANSLYKILAKEREKRAAISTEILKNDLKLSNEDGFKLIDQVIAFTHDEFFRLWKKIPDEEKSTRDLLKILELGHKYLETRLKANGAIKEEDEVSNEDLLNKIHKMTQEAQEAKEKS